MPRDQAYFVQSDAGKGRGVLVLHSLWGLTSSVKSRCDQLADEGYTVLAPDINFGELPESQQEGLDRLGNASPDRLASLVLSSAGLLDEQSTDGPIAIVGFGMGVSLALWASVRLKGRVAAVVSYYGTLQIDFAGSESSYLIHYANRDDFITDDEAAFMEATMGLESLSLRTHRYEGTEHGFCEPDGDTFDPEACEKAWSTTLDFLRSALAD